MKYPVGLIFIQIKRYKSIKADFFSLKVKVPLKQILWCFSTHKNKNITKMVYVATSQCNQSSIIILVTKRLETDWTIANLFAFIDVAP